MVKNNMKSAKKYQKTAINAKTLKIYIVVELHKNRNIKCKIASIKENIYIKGNTENINFKNPLTNGGELEYNSSIFEKIFYNS